MPDCASSCVPRTSLVTPVLHFLHVGQITSILQNCVKPQNKKYFAFPEVQIRCISIAIPSHPERASAVVTTRGGLRWTLRLRLTRAAKAYGKDVWS